MKLHKIVLIGLILGSSVAVAEKTTTKNTDTAKFIGYSGLALTNAGLSLVTLYGIEREGFWLRIAATLAPAILAKKDANAAWDYYQKAFIAKNELEQSTSLTPEETKESSTKNVQTAKLIDDSRLDLTPTLGVLAGLLTFLFLGDKSWSLKNSVYYLLYGQACFRLAFSDHQSIQELRRKASPSNDINKETTHETA